MFAGVCFGFGAKAFFVPMSWWGFFEKVASTEWQGEYIIRI